MILFDRLADWFRGWRGPVVAGSTAVIAGAPPADNALVHHVAERLRQGDLAAGGWSAEAGALPLESYVPEAQRLVRTIALGGIEGGPPSP